MTVQVFLILLTAFSAVTGLVVEALKKLLEGKDYSANILAAGTALVIGIGGTALYYLTSSIPFDTLNIIYMILMGIASAIGSMVGYDKIKQIIQQLGVK